MGAAPSARGAARARELFTRHQPVDAREAIMSHNVAQALRFRLDQIEKHGHTAASDDAREIEKIVEDIKNETIDLLHRVRSSNAPASLEIVRTGLNKTAARLFAAADRIDRELARRDGELDLGDAA